MQLSEIVFENTIHQEAIQRMRGAFPAQQMKITAKSKMGTELMVDQNL